MIAGMARTHDSIMDDCLFYYIMLTALAVRALWVVGESITVCTSAFTVALCVAHCSQFEHSGDSIISSRVAAYPIVHTFMSTLYIIGFGSVTESKGLELYYSQ